MPQVSPRHPIISSFSCLFSSSCPYLDNGLLVVCTQGIQYTLKLRHGRFIYPVVDESSLLACSYELIADKNAHVVRQRRLRDIEMLQDIARTARTCCAYNRQNLKTHRLGENRKS